MHEIHLFRDLGLSILGAACLGSLAYLLRIPMLLAYIGAGILLGPYFGFGLIKNATSIATLSHIGLVMLMFILGLEINLGKLLRSGRAVFVTGITQLIGCIFLALLFFSLLFPNMMRFELYYIAVAASLSSTLLVVKILSEKMELGTFPSRVSLGVLVIQDLAAIVFLSIQPTLGTPDPQIMALAVLRAIVLVMVTYGIARYFLPVFFKKISSQPELMLVSAMAWCFAVCGMANALSLSLEMGALIAGVTIASFPYHAEIAAKVTSLRDFFVTLFFVAVGLEIRPPSTETLFLSLALLAFVIMSRFLTVFPALHFMGYGNRAGILPALNLAQLSEFALVLGALGVQYQHIRPELVSSFVLVFTLASLLSSFAMPKGHQLYSRINPLLKKLGLRDHVGSRQARQAEDEIKGQSAEIVLLGFYHDASSLLREIELSYPREFLTRILVIDLNPEAHRKLREIGVRAIYGDISHAESLRHLQLQDAKLLICTIPDHTLKGITNVKLLSVLKRLAPDARIITTAQTLESAREMYREGADYVFVPRIISAHYLVDVVFQIYSGKHSSIREKASAYMATREEILP